MSESLQSYQNTLSGNGPETSQGRGHQLDQFEEQVFQSSYLCELSSDLSEGLQYDIDVNVLLATFVNSNDIRDISVCYRYLAEEVKRKTGREVSFDTVRETVIRMAYDLIERAAQAQHGGQEEQESDGHYGNRREALQLKLVLQIAYHMEYRVLAGLLKDLNSEICNYLAIKAKPKAIVAWVSL